MEKFLFGLLCVASVEAALETVGIGAGTDVGVLNRRQTAALENLVGIIENGNASLIGVQTFAELFLLFILLAAFSQAVFADQSTPYGEHNSVAVVVLTHQAASSRCVVPNAIR